MKAIVGGDRPVLTQRIAQLLERHGFQVTQVATQEEVIELLAQDTFDLMLLVAPEDQAAALNLISTAKSVRPAILTYLLAQDGAMSQIIPKMQSIVGKKVSINDLPIALKEELARADVEREHFRLQWLRYVEELLEAVRIAASVREATQKVVEQLQTLLMCRGAAVALNLDVNKPPVAVAAAGDTEKISRVWKEASTIYQWVAENQTPLFLRRGQSSIPVIQRDVVVFGLGSCAFIPIVTTQRLIGVLAVERKPGEEAFSDSAFSLAQVAAKALSLRLETEQTASSDEMRQMLQQERELRQAMENTFGEWRDILVRLAREVGSLVDIRRGQPSDRSETISKLAGALAEQLGMDTLHLTGAIYLRDVGTLAIRDMSLSRLPQPPSVANRSAGEHAEIGFEVLTRVRLSAAYLEVVRHHHENYDGTGVPDGLKGEEIPPLARVVRVVEDYVTMTAPGDGGHSVPSPVALAQLSSESGNIYDPKIADTFIKMMRARGVSPEQQTLSLISHELRTPLTYLMGFSELLAARQDLPPQAKDMATELHKQTEQMVILTERLLELSRLEAGRVALTRQWVNLKELLEEQVTKSKALSQLHTFRIEAPNYAIRINIDTTRSAQAVSNLLSNAIKYSPKGGEIVVKLEEKPKEVLVSVSDQGVGIPKEHLGRLFQPFYRVQGHETRKIEGLGLGLALTRAIVEAHGGKIEVTSEPGKGSVFSFSLPKQEGKA